MKSHVSDLLELATYIYTDAVAKCTDVTLDLRDLLTLRNRAEHEGLSFLTITLPSFGKDFDRSLSEGQIEPTLFRSFRKRGRVPAFLQGFLALVFDEIGRIRHEPSIEAIEGIRQIAYAFKKLRVPCTPRRIAEALTEFKATEHVFEEPIRESSEQDFLAVCACVWGTTFGIGVDLHTEARPKHGPGATAERISGNAKYVSSRWHDRLEPYFPVLDNAFANADAHLGQGFKNVTIVGEADEQPVRVITVPKTLKTPRIIAIEPVCMQYTQQALAEFIVDRLENGLLTSGHTNFRDQKVNRRLAKISSKDGKSATIDLSSASDRVPYSLALRMFDRNPVLRDAIDACRSKTAQTPDGDIIHLKKFASMGSALCFPIESMYFYTICIVGLLRSHNLPMTFSNIYDVSRNVYVYGDDIIIPADQSETVTRTLHEYYCKVNVHKSYSVGNFRESCGMDAFAGEEVTPTYIRELRPRNRRDAPALISWIKTANLLYKRGYWLTSSYMLKHVERLLGKLPVVGERCGGLGKESFQKSCSIERWNQSTHAFEVKTWTACPVYRKDVLDGDPALLKCLLSLERKTDRNNDQLNATKTDEKHLERSARHGAVVLKRRWVQPY